MDHAKEAERLLNPLTHGAKSDRYAEAQVHATLALAEQQRITNRLALAGLIADEQRHYSQYGARGNLHGTAQVFVYGPDGDSVLKPDIARALGLDSEGDK